MAHTTIQIRTKHIGLSSAHLIFHNTAFQLIGGDDDPFDLPGIPFKGEDELLLHFESSGQLMYANGVYTSRIMVAFFFRRYEYAAECIGKYHTQMRKRNFVFQTTFHTFYVGLVAFQMCRSKIDVHEWLTVGKEAIKKFRDWAKHSEWNFENKLFLLEAEFLLSEGDHNSAEKKYFESIESARRHRFVHEEGVAKDLLASFYKTQGNTEKQKEFFSGALRCYDAWGATAVVRHLSNQ